MALTIKIKRGTVAPTALSYGELGFNDAANELYIGKSDGTVQKLIGSGGTVDPSIFLRKDIDDSNGSHKLTLGEVVATNASGGTGNISAYGNIGAQGELSGNTLSINAAAAIGGDLTVIGNLVVNGTTTTVNSANSTFGDTLIELNSGIDSVTTNLNDIGIIMNRGASGDNAVFLFKEADDYFYLGTTTASASATGDIAVTIGTLKANIIGNITGDVTGNLNGNAASASKLDHSVTFSLSGAVTGSVVSDLSGTTVAISTTGYLKTLADVDDVLAPAATNILQYDGSKWTTSSIIDGGTF